MQQYLSPVTFKYVLVLYIMNLHSASLIALCSSGLETSLSVYLVSAVDQLCGFRCDNMTSHKYHNSQTIPTAQF